MAIPLWGLLQRICLQFVSQIGNERLTCIADLGTNPYFTAWADMKGVVVAERFGRDKPASGT